MTDGTESTPVGPDETGTAALQLSPDDSDDSDGVVVLHESGLRSSILQLFALPQTEAVHPVRVNKTLS